MKVKLITIGFLGALLTAALPAAAHHSFAMYDLSVSKTLTGKLTRFIVGANHSQLIFNLVGADGQELKGDDWAFGYNAGLLFEFNPHTRVGLQYRSRIDHTLRS